MKSQLKRNLEKAMFDPETSGFEIDFWLPSFEGDHNAWEYNPNFNVTFHEMLRKPSERTRLLTIEIWEQPENWKL